MARMFLQGRDVFLPKNLATEKTTEANASPATAPPISRPVIQQATVASRLRKLSNLPDGVWHISEKP